jgi:hypothetical protein
MKDGSDEPEAWRRAFGLYISTSLRDGDSGTWEPIPKPQTLEAPAMLAEAGAPTVQIFGLAHAFDQGPQAKGGEEKALSVVSGMVGFAPQAALLKDKGANVAQNTLSPTKEKPPDATGQGMPAFVQAAGTFVGGRRMELRNRPQEMSQIEIPFAPAPSSLRLVMLWCVLVSLFVAGVVASLYFSGVFDKKLREAPTIRCDCHFSVAFLDPVFSHLSARDTAARARGVQRCSQINIEIRPLHGSGCGSPGRDQVEMIVKMIGMSKSELLQQCPQVRTTMG